jgi:hypothetical protein
MKVVHVVSSSKFARKCEEAGVDAIVAEGFEAGGHNGREETTTLTLIPQVRRATTLPLIAAGGIGSGEAMLAAMVLGAEGVQIGTLFALSEESSASDAFKQLCISLNEGDTMLALKRLSPTRLIKNAFFDRMNTAEEGGATADELREMIGFGATRRGIFEGDIENGELEIGQVVSAIKEIKPVAQIIDELVSDFEATRQRLADLHPQRIADMTGIRSLNDYYAAIASQGLLFYKKSRHWYSLRFNPVFFLSGTLRCALCCPWNCPSRRPCRCFCNHTSDSTAIHPRIKASAAFPKVRRYRL